jgi:hypothetical protein
MFKQISRNSHNPVVNVKNTDTYNIRNTSTTTTPNPMTDIQDIMKTNTFFKDNQIFIKNVAYLLVLKWSPRMFHTFK